MVESKKDYKSDVMKRLYRNYFLRLHESEKDIEFTSTKLVYADIFKFFKGRKRILDAGCGDGLFIEFATKKGLRCEGFDNNIDLLSQCKKKGMKVRYANFAEKLPYMDNSFDAIHFSNVIEHLHEPEFALYELIRVLKPGGIIIVTVPEIDRLYWGDWTHVRPFTKQTFDYMMKCYDVKLYHVMRRHFPVLVIHWRNPIVRAFNWVVKYGILAEIFTYLFERIIKIRRHDLVVMIVK
jgi:ubiquinone/menaquinone biosynthesis C-methylase UbiE